VKIFGRRVKSGDVISLSARELKQRLDRGEKLAVVDVRQQADFEEHPSAIPGAIRVPPTVLPERYGELPSDRLLVFVCT